ncbi:MAG: serine/threonine-protein kinase, partial [Planctomycetota bacterium]|nr:serine/threonine-protein kinase [Planctomycetota bacterium]
MATGRQHIESEFPRGHMLGRYRIEEPVGQGGMGTVYRAFDETTNRNVAVKILAPGISEALRERFLAECEAQAKIRHPHVMPVYDQAWLTDERPYFTMELLYDPITLTEIVQWTADGSLSKRYPRIRHWADPVKLVRDVLLPISDGIAVSNVEYRIQHRDLKPDNILIDTRTRRPYVIDYGICRDIDGVQAETKIVGTPRFLSPEQARGKVDARTDVWGLGSLIHFAITGRPPLRGSSQFTRPQVKERITQLLRAEQKATGEGREAEARGYAARREQFEADGFRTLEDLYSDARKGIYLPLPDEVSTSLRSIVAKAMAPEPTERYENAR